MSGRADPIGQGRIGQGDFVLNQKQEEDVTGRGKFLLSFFGCVFLIVVALWFWLASKPVWKTGVEYKFEYTHQFIDKKTGLVGRNFILGDNQQPFRTLERGSRGEVVTIRDSNLSMNTFKLIYKDSPEFVADGLILQSSYSYIEAHFNTDKTETQTVVPTLEVIK